MEALGFGGKYVIFRDSDIGFYAARLMLVSGKVAYESKFCFYMEDAIRLANEHHIKVIQSLFEQ